jgi:hypothetical protein
MSAEYEDCPSWPDSMPCYTCKPVERMERRVLGRAGDQPGRSDRDLSPRMRTPCDLGGGRWVNIPASGLGRGGEVMRAITAGMADGAATLARLAAGLVLSGQAQADDPTCTSYLEPAK